jgi:hypothetical protein
MTLDARVRWELLTMAVEDRYSLHEAAGSVLTFSPNMERADRILLAEGLLRDLLREDLICMFWYLFAEDREWPITDLPEIDLALRNKANWEPGLPTERLVYFAATDKGKDIWHRPPSS